MKTILEMTFTTTTREDLSLDHKVLLRKGSGDRLGFSGGERWDGFRGGNAVAVEELNGLILVDR